MEWNGFVYRQPRRCGVTGVASHVGNLSCHFITPRDLLPESIEVCLDEIKLSAKLYLLALIRFSKLFSVD